MRVFSRIAGVLVLLYAAFLATVYAWMRQPPEEFAGHMAKMPGPAMMAFPFATMWSKARAGVLGIGDAAPDFDLQTIDKQSHVRLSTYRGSKPVVLVFGSYT